MPPTLEGGGHVPPAPCSDITELYVQNVCICCVGVRYLRLYGISCVNHDGKHMPPDSPPSSTSNDPQGSPCVTMTRHQRSPAKLAPKSWRTDDNLQAHTESMAALKNNALPPGPHTKCPDGARRSRDW